MSGLSPEARAEIARQLDRDKSDDTKWLWTDDANIYYATHESNGMSRTSTLVELDDTVNPCEVCGRLTANAHGFCNPCLLVEDDNDRREGYRR